MSPEKENMTMPARAEDSKDELDAVRKMFGASFAELAELFRDDTPRRLAALRGAQATGDSARAAQVAHALGGSSVSIGATALSALCKALEKQTRAGILDDCEARMAAIEAEYQRISERLESMLTE